MVSLLDGLSGNRLAWPGNDLTAPRFLMQRRPGRQRNRKTFITKKYSLQAGLMALGFLSWWQCWRADKLVGEGLPQAQGDPQRES